MGQGILGNTIQFWLLRHGFVEDRKHEINDQRVIQPVDRPGIREADQRLGRPTIQKPDRKIDRPPRQQPRRGNNRPVNR